MFIFNGNIDPCKCKIIGPYAFHDCVALNTVIFEHESQLNLIDDYAFLDCSSLISIEIPANVEKLDIQHLKIVIRWLVFSLKKGQN